MNNKIIPIIFGIVGVILIAVTIYIYLQQMNFLSHSQSAAGTVIKNVASLSGKHGTTIYAPVVTFTTTAGQAQQFQSAVASETPLHKIGDHVEVLYDPANPPTPKSTLP